MRDTELAARFRHWPLSVLAWTVMDPLRARPDDPRGSGLGQALESVVVTGLAARFAIAWTIRGTGSGTAIVDGQIVGSIALDAEDLGGNRAHQRWLILSIRRGARALAGSYWIARCRESPSE